MNRTSENKAVPAMLTLFLFLGITFLVVTNYDWFNTVDSSIYRLHWEPNETVTGIINVFAKSATIVPIFTVSLIMSFILWRKKNKLLAFWLSCNVLAVSFIGYILKHVIARVRPDVGQLAERTSYSFPSGHSLLAMCFVCSMFIALKTINPNKFKGLKIALIAYVVLIGITRIFLRVHYPSDVLGGFLLSYTWVNLSYVCLQKLFLTRKFSSPAAKKQFVQKLILGGVFLILMVVTAVSMYGATAYKSVQKTADKMYQPLDRDTTPVKLADHEPVSFLLLGIANDSKRQTDYRANTIMVVTINDQLKKTTITSIPRDAYVEIVGKYGLYDKINHAHSYGGEKMIIDTVEKYLEIPINHYFVINMDGLAALGDAVGGVTVNNDFEFDAEGIHYPQGEQHLNGWETLQYARMRYEDPDGDYGRQKRQREVTVQLVNELMSVKSVFRYQELLDVIGENGQTDMTLDQMILLMTNYQRALENIESYQVQGEDFTGDGFTGEEGISYQSIPEEERLKTIAELKKQLAIE